MKTDVPHKKANPAKPEKNLILKYEGEDDRLFLVSGRDRSLLSVPKNRNVPRSTIDPSTQPFNPVFRLLLFAFIGLAPAGLGTLVLAPLAALWALAIVIKHPLSRSDTIRVAIVWGIAAGLLAIAIPLSKLLLARFL